MTQLSLSRRMFWAAAIPTTLLLALILLMLSPVFAQHSSQLDWAITADMLFLVPLVYWLFIRKTDVPNFTVVPVFVLSIVLASIFLPAENQGLLSWVKTWIVPIVELTAFTLIVLKIRKVRKAFKAEMREVNDFYSAILKSVSVALSPKVAPFLGVELSVVYYGFLNWKKRHLAPNEFSYHKNSSSAALFGALVMIIAIETVALHFLLVSWSPLTAWILSILSVYTGLQFLGIARSFSKRPHLLANEKLYLRYGFAAETVINLENIESVELTRKDVELDDETRKLSLLGAMDGHNVFIKLKAPEVWKGLYGMKKTYRKLLISVDDAQGFEERLGKRISEISR